MKSNKKLGEIGAKAAALWLQSKMRGYHLAVNENSCSYLGESAGRESFAATVAAEVRKESAEEIATLTAELAKHQWRPVSVLPTKADADVEGHVFVCSADGRIRGMHRIEWPFSTGVTHWRPFVPPPAPSAEDLERAEFEKWWSCQPSWVHENNTKDAVFMGWQAARAGKEAK
jgi:hypothetical protein